MNFSTDNALSNSAANPNACEQTKTSMQIAACLFIHTAAATAKRVLSCIAAMGTAALAASIIPASVMAEDQAVEWRAQASAENSFVINFWKGADLAFSITPLAWGPNYSGCEVKSTDKSKGDELLASAPLAINQSAGQTILFKQRVWNSADQDISITYEFSSSADVTLSMMIAAIAMQSKFQDGDVLCKHADATESSYPLSGGQNASQRLDTASMVFRSKSLGNFTVSIDPAAPTFTWDTPRIQFAQDSFKAGKKSVTLTFHLPGPVKLDVKEFDIAQYTRSVAEKDWYPVTATDDVKPSVIGFEPWLDKPAGKHGGVRMVGDHFEFEDKTPVKFWGTNLAYAASAPEKTVGEHTAARFAKYGINGVRMHKFTGSEWSGVGDKNDATKMTPEGMDRLDYFADQLAKNGIYYGWSHSYHYTVRPSNKDRLLAYDEIMNASKGDTYALMNIAEDCQDLLIETAVNLLNHKNPYTGKTYAEDPALSYVELQNEDDIFFFSTSYVFEKFPTYKKNLMERYTKWLREKYKDQAGLQAAWDGALKADETLEAKNISLFANPWDMSVGGLKGKTGGTLQRRLDNAAFYHFVQNKFYSRYVKAIRDTGYKGPLVGSPWEGPSGLPHYYNLKSDYLVGYIDRHNYFEGAFEDSALSIPGCGLLSAGFQQFADRPFALSEWVHMYPMAYTAEAPAIVATYGLGLQGWDASYEFQSMLIPKNLSDTVNNTPWNTDAPSQLGQFPALARMIMRADVKEGQIIGVRNVSPQNLATGKFDFVETVVQHGAHGDVKSFSGDTPIAALAAGRLVARFTDQDTPSIFPDMTKYESNKSIVSTTKQLTWNYLGKGYFTVNSDGTKAVVGFARDKKLQLGTCSFTVRTPFASIYLTSLEKAKDLTHTKNALITAFARSVNSGFKLSTLDNKVLAHGEAPILMEPVKADIACGRPIAAVNILDHDGQRTGKTLPVTGNGFQIDGAREKTMYYEVVFK